jgi:hypothetical protein
MSKHIHRAIVVIALTIVGCGSEPERSRLAAPSDAGKTGDQGQQADAPPAKRNIPTH